LYREKIDITAVTLEKRFPNTGPTHACFMMVVFFWTHAYATDRVIIIIIMCVPVR